MEINVGHLRQLIREEVGKILLEYETYLVRHGKNLYLTDDEGNEDFYDSVEGSGYEHLKDGETIALSHGTGRHNYGSRSGYYTPGLRRF